MWRPAYCFQFRKIKYGYLWNHFLHVQFVSLFFLQHKTSSEWLMGPDLYMLLCVKLCWSSSGMKDIFFICEAVRCCFLLHYTKYAPSHIIFNILVCVLWPLCQIKTSRLTSLLGLPDLTFCYCWHKHRLSNTIAVISSIWRKFRCVLSFWGPFEKEHKISPQYTQKPQHEQGTYWSSVSCCCCRVSMWTFSIRQEMPSDIQLRST